jgi:hypothetical protein
MQRRSAARRRWSGDGPESTEGKPGIFRNKRVMAVGAAVLAFVALLTVTQISSAATRRKQQQQRNNPACATATAKAPATAQAPGSSAASTGAPKASGSAAADADAADASAGDVPKADQSAGTIDGGVQNGRRVQNHLGDGQVAGRPNWRRVNPNCPTPAPTTSSTSGGNNGGNTGGSLDTLGADCSQSRLQAHDGFQNGNRCVSTAFGEVSALAKNPTLLITRAPQRVRVGQAFSIQVSTRNLVRDRFLAAAQGGYYKESAFLTRDGLTRGHFHTGCRMLQSTRSAPDPAVAPAFFVATEDGGGSERPDTITINITGMPTAGIAQCASWAGDGSHRIPMMEKANATPAFDTVRITVTN